MAAIQEELYDAFISAGAEELKARAAAQVMTEYPKPDEMATKVDLKGLEERTDRKFAEVKSEMAEMKAEIMRALWLQAISIIGINLTAIGIAVAILSK